MFIDAHQHFWKYNPVRDSWIDETMGVLKKDFLPKELVPILKSNNIDGCIAVQADQSEEETQFLLDLAKDNPIIKGVVGWVDLMNENVESRLAHFSKDLKFKGVRHILQAETEDFILNPDFQKGISKLEKFKLTYDILVFPNQINNIITLVKKFPNQVFILDHIGKPYIKSGKIKYWKEAISELASYPNVYCKISGMVTEANLKTWNTKDFKLYLDVVFESFGIDRLLFASDWPVCLLAAKYEEVLKICMDYIALLSKNEQNKIMGLNAIQVYNLHK